VLLIYSFTMNKWRLYAEISAAGLVFVAAVLIGLWLGQWLDKVTGVDSLFTLLMLALAVLGAVLNLVRTLRKIDAAS